MIRLLFVGDLVGQDGLEICVDFLPLLRRDYKIDVCVVNGENCDAGKGIKKKQAQKLMQAGADVITGGNHIFQKDSEEVLKDPSMSVLRPANYPAENPGKGYLVISKDSCKVGIVNLQGRSFLPPIDCPFKTGLAIVEEIRKETPLIFVDFHAEASAEKQALAWFLDGKISALAGTHTHVQTADERILNKGTAFITDVGMTGPFDSVIGMDPQTAIIRFITQRPRYFKLSSRNLRLNGILVDMNENTGKATAITRLNFSREEYGRI